jgi:hypothetical protein
MFFTRSQFPAAAWAEFKDCSNEWSLNRPTPGICFAYKALHWKNLPFLRNRGEHQAVDVLFCPRCEYDPAVKTGPRSPLHSGICLRQQLIRRLRKVGQASSLSALGLPKSNADRLEACPTYLLPRHNILRMTRKPHDMQPAPRPVRAIDQPAIVHLDVVGLNHLLASSSDLRIAGRMANSIFGAKRHRVLVRRGNEISDFLHGNGSRISNTRVPALNQENIAILP